MSIEQKYVIYILCVSISHWKDMLVFGEQPVLYD
jgi:hypothetical protein